MGKGGNKKEKALDAQKQAIYLQEARVLKQMRADVDRASEAVESKDRSLDAERASLAEDRLLVKQVSEALKTRLQLQVEMLEMSSAGEGNDPAGGEMSLKSRQQKRDLAFHQQAMERMSAQIDRLVAAVEPAARRRGMGDGSGSGSGSGSSDGGGGSGSDSGGGSSDGGTEMEAKVKKLEKAMAVEAEKEAAAATRAALEKVRADSDAQHCVERKKWADEKKRVQRLLQGRADEVRMLEQKQQLLEKTHQKAMVEEQNKHSQLLAKAQEVVQVDALRRGE